MKPRWPYKDVNINEQAYQNLLQVQGQLEPKDIKLVLTRGYESQGLLIRCLHKIARIMGGFLFCLVYPSRAGECFEIFSANGHDKLDTCIDLQICYNGQALKLLPMGVFTPKWLVQRKRKQWQGVIELVYQNLEEANFRIHKNMTEAMQIHCEFQQR